FGQREVGETGFGGFVGARTVRGCRHRLPPGARELALHRWGKGEHRAHCHSIIRPAPYGQWSSLRQVIGAAHWGVIQSVNSSTVFSPVRSIVIPACVATVMSCSTVSGSLTLVASVAASAPL